jgi:AcrR family transcriptional regulator
MSDESNPTGWSDVTRCPKVSMVINEAPSKSTRATRRRAQSFKSLVRAGLAVIAKHGVYETTVEHITEAADVGKGTFYAHFPSKEALLYYLVRNGFDEMIAAGRKESPAGRTPAERLAALIRAQLDVLGRRRDLIILMHQVRGLLILEPRARQHLRREFQRYIEFLTEEFRQVLRIPHLKNAEARDLACAVAGFISGTLSFELLVRSHRGVRKAPQGPIHAFAAGLASRYVSSRRRANGGRPR